MNKLDIVKALLSEDSKEETSDFKIDGSKIKIVILQRGWVFIGRFSQVGSICKLTDACNIRTWGTTKGLGELAESGPTSTTKLDKVNDVSFHELTSIAVLDVDDKIWDKELK
jgi:hypothetical protein